MVRSAIRAAACAATLLLAAAAAPAAAPPGKAEPSSLPGGTVIHTVTLAAALSSPGKPHLIDVSPAPARPPALAPGAVWLPLPHLDIPGSVWLPGAGAETLSPAADSALRAKVASLTADDRSAPLAVYCHPHCRLSWRAASRLIGYGYTQVQWDPDGIEGWEAAGHALAPVSPGWTSPGP